MALAFPGISRLQEQGILACNSMDFTVAQNSERLQTLKRSFCEVKKVFADFAFTP